MRNVVTLIGLVVLCVGGYYGYTQIMATPPAAGGPGAMMGGGPPGGIPIEAARVIAKPHQKTLNTVGTLRAEESLVLRPEISGRIESIPLQEGSAAKKGDLLIQIDDRTSAASLKQAQAEVQLAQVTYNRAKLLKEKGAGTVSGYDSALAALRVAQAQETVERTQLEKTRIVAPFDGVIGLRHVSPGDYVIPGQELVNFQNTYSMKVDFALPEIAARYLTANQPITISVDALPGKNLTGVVYAIDPQIDQQNRSILLRARVANDEGMLKSGFFARIALSVGENNTALFVPESALMPRGNENFVFVIGADKKVSTQKVTVGDSLNGEVEIVEGLDAAAIVVSAGPLKLRDGADVSYTLTGDSQ